MMGTKARVNPRVLYTGAEGERVHSRQREQVGPGQEFTEEPKQALQGGPVPLLLSLLEPRQRSQLGSDCRAAHTQEESGDSCTRRTANQRLTKTPVSFTCNKKATEQANNIRTPR